MIDALHETYNISYGLALFLALPGLFKCGIAENIEYGTIDLHQLALHGKIGHHFSLAHADANGAKFAPTTVYEKRLSGLLNIVRDEGTTYLTREDFETYCALIKLKSKAKKDLDLIYELVLDGEIALTCRLWPS